MSLPFKRLMFETAAVEIRPRAPLVLLDTIFERAPPQTRRRLRRSEIRRMLPRKPREPRAEGQEAQSLQRKESLLKRVWKWVHEKQGEYIRPCRM